MFKNVSACFIAALVASSTAASAQSRSMYHWGSFSDTASVWASDEGYQVYVEEYGPLKSTEGWPVRAYVNFDLWNIGVHGGCWIPPDAFILDQKSGQAQLDVTLPSADGCDWLTGADSVRIRLTWWPDAAYYSRRHYTLLGDTNETSSEQGWEDRWRVAAVDGQFWLDDDTLSTPIHSDAGGMTFRGWGHGVIPLFGDAR